MNRNRKGISHARAGTLSLRCLLSLDLETKKRSEEGRSKKHHHASFSERWNHAALYSPLLSLFSRQRAAGTQTRNRACLDCRCNEGEDISDAFKDRLLFRMWQSEQAENMSRLSLTIRRPMSWDESLAMGRLGSLTEVPRQRKEGGSREERNKGREI